MRRLLKQIVEALDRRFQPERRFARYVVTPRQGRHVVRRRLLRSLRRRMKTQDLVRFDSLKGVELAGRAAMRDASFFKFNRHAT